MDSVLALLKDLVTTAISKSFPDINWTNPSIRCNSSDNYESDDPIDLIHNVPNLRFITPAAVAGMIIQNVPANNVIGSLRFTSSSTIEIIISDYYLGSTILNIIKNGIHIKDKVRRKVIVDFSSPNVGRQMHVRHLRSTIIGQAISNILEFLGHQVIRVNFIGDWGEHFGYIIALFLEKWPDYVNNKITLEHLSGLIDEAHARYKSDETFRIKSKECYSKLMADDVDMISVWKTFCRAYINDFNSIYEILEINNLVEKGESFYRNQIEETVNEIVDKDMTVQVGQKVMVIPLQKTAPLTLIEADGSYTSAAVDLACLSLRLLKEKAERVIYVTDADHVLHFGTLFACARKAKYYDPDVVKIENVAFGLFGKISLSFLSCFI